MKKNDWVRLVIFVLTIELLGLLSSLLSGDISAHYRMLIKPPFSPPGLVFGIVWPILYALLGAAASLIYPIKTRQRNNALIWFVIQLMLNLSWSIVFFRFEAYWAALIILLAMDIITAYLISLFRKLNKYAWLLIIPYMIWILFATYLCLGVALLN